MFLRKDQSIPLITSLALVLGKISRPTRVSNLGKDLKAGNKQSANNNSWFIHLLNLSQLSEIASEYER